jgi:hypothetical protein
MPLLSNPAFGPRTALVYITVGALLDIWTIVYYVWFAGDDQGNVSRTTWFWLSGLFLTGLILMLIGFYLGRIGRAARKAELPPREATAAEANIQQTAATVPQPMMPGMAPVPMPGMIPAGPVTMAPPAVPPAGSPPPGGQYVPGVTRR